MRSHSLKPIGSIILLCLALSTPSHAAVPCNSTHNPCELLLWKGSQCKRGFCTNPFQGGCLKSILKGEEYARKYSTSPENSLLRQRVLRVQRVCNSEDGDIDLSHCQANTNDGYQEVRIFPQNWESAIATSWILQIILSELLGVPASLETGVAEQSNNFYNENNQMDYGVTFGADQLASFQNAFDAKEGDCAIYKSQEGIGYVPCAHYMPETWRINEKIILEKQAAGVIEPPRLAGGVGIDGWRITKFSLENDASLGIYYGYQGEENRQKLADTFKRPTTWRDYCIRVSSNNCTIPDGASQRAPAEDGSEDGRYFVGGSYTGHFRATDKNNCTKTEKCTGHFIDYPCDWRSHFNLQAYHLGISLESKEVEGGRGYTHAERVDILKAANATRSDIIGMWWAPEGVASEFLGTDAELVQVMLPAPTEECIRSRVPDDRCYNNVTYYGEEVGSCDIPPTGLRKIVVGNMQMHIDENSDGKARMSPAYDVITNFEISELQLEQILNDWTSRDIDPYNFDLRFATCKWIADNLDHVRKYIPQSHPRVFTITSSKTHPLSISAMVISAMAICVAAFAAFLTTGRKLQCELIRRLAIQKNIQTEFVYLLIAGQILVSVGALLMAIPPSNGSCISSVWFLNVGYTLVLVPILVRVSAIIKVVQAAKKFRRVTVDKNRLIGASLGISTVSALFCAVWTVVDPPRVSEELTTTNEMSDLGETVVEISSYCESDSTIWNWVVTVWQGLLLVCASVLAFQMRSAPKIVKEAPQTDINALAFMIYASSMFLILRIALSFLSNALSEGSITKGSLQSAQSLLWSFDSMVNICIYSYKFFFSKNSKNGESLHRSEVTAGPTGSQPSTDTHWRDKGEENEDEEKVEEDEPSRHIQLLRESMVHMQEQNTFLHEENAELKQLLTVSQHEDPGDSMRGDKMCES